MSDRKWECGRHRSDRDSDDGDRDFGRDHERERHHHHHHHDEDRQGDDDRRDEHHHHHDGDPDDDGHRHEDRQEHHDERGDGNGWDPGRDWDGSNPGEHRRDGSAFRDLVRSLIGETVSLVVDETTFSGRIACVETSFVTIATRRRCSSTPGLAFVPIRRIQGVRIS